MKQSRLMSLVESVANVIVGYCVAVATQILIFPIFGLHTTLAQNLKMGAVFTVVSVTRSYVLRRLFENWRGWHAACRPERRVDEKPRPTLCVPINRSDASDLQMHQLHSKWLDFISKGLKQLFRKH